MDQVKEKKYELLDIADKIIIEEEYNDIDTHRINADDFYIHNYRTNKWIKIQVNDTEESIREKIEKSYERE